jgi:thiol-disulfide isomerase/thioredoxin
MKRLLALLFLLLAPWPALAEDGPDASVWSAGSATRPALSDLVTLSGEPLAPKLQGKKVLLHFWATWCGPCIVELPALDRLAAELEGRGLVVVAVSLDRKTDDLTRFLERQGTPAHLLMVQDAERKLAKPLGLKILPSTIVLGADGIETARLTGTGDWSGADRQRLEEKLP